MRHLPAVLVLLGFAVYASGLAAPFLYDDFGMIVRDESIRTLWPIGGHPNRPVLTLSFALGYALHGLEPSGFRLVNVAIHVTAALLLYGLVRRTILLGRVAGLGESGAASVAFAIAAVWVVHPLNTQAVTYIWQRGESLMGMLFFATLYAAVRAAEGARRPVWMSTAIVCFFLGCGTKESMVAVIPVLLLLDGILIAPSLRAALRDRRAIYAVLGAVAVLALVFVLPATHTSFGRVGAWEYAASQPGIVLDYLRLAVWPHPLSFDHGRAPAQGIFAIGVPALVVAALLAMVVRALLARTWRGVAGAWFFLALAPTSSFVAINDLMVEYRMYVPLVGVIAIGVGAAQWLCSRLRVRTTGALALVIVVFGALTARRNLDYTSHIALWDSVLEVHPDNFRAHSYLVSALLADGRDAEAIAHARRAAELRPEFGSHWNLASAFRSTGHFEAALEHYEHALAYKPHRADALREVGNMLLKLDRPADALAPLEESIRRGPGSTASHVLIASAYERIGRQQDAIAALRRALERDPARAGSWHRLGRLLAATARYEEAIDPLERALAIRPSDPSIHEDLARMYAQTGRHARALPHFEAALRGDPSRAGFLSGLALDAVAGPRTQELRAMSVRVAELAAAATGRSDDEVLLNLARIYARTGRRDEAAAVFDHVLRLPELARDAARRSAIEAERRAIAPR